MNRALTILAILIFSALVYLQDDDYPNSDFVRGLPQHEVCKAFSDVATRDEREAHRRYQDAYLNPAEFGHLAEAHKEYHSLDMLWREAVFATQEGGDRRAKQYLSNRFGTEDSSKWKMKVPISMQKRK